MTTIVQRNFKWMVSWKEDDVELSLRKQRQKKQN